MSDLITLFPNCTVETTSGPVTVKPFTFGQLPLVLQKARTIYGGVSHLLENGGGEAAVVLEIMAVGGDDLISLMCISTGKDRDFFDALQMDEGVQVTSAFLEVNLSFFVQRVLPQFKEAMEKLQAVTGPKSSST